MSGDIDCAMSDESSAPLTGYVSSGWLAHPTSVPSPLLLPVPQTPLIGHIPSVWSAQSGSAPEPPPLAAPTPMAASTFMLPDTFGLSGAPAASMRFTAPGTSATHDTSATAVLRLPGTTAGTLFDSSEIGVRRLFARALVEQRHRLSELEAMLLNFLSSAMMS